MGASAQGCAFPFVRPCAACGLPAPARAAVSERGPSGPPAAGPTGGPAKCAHGFRVSAAQRGFLSNRTSVFRTHFMAEELRRLGNIICKRSNTTHSRGDQTGGQVTDVPRQGGQAERLRSRRSVQEGTERGNLDGAVSEPSHALSHVTSTAACHIQLSIFLQ